MLVKNDCVFVEEGEIVNINCYPYLGINMSIVKLNKDMYDAIKNIEQENRAKLYCVLSRCS